MTFLGRCLCTFSQVLRMRTFCSIPSLNNVRCLSTFQHARSSWQKQKKRRGQIEAVSRKPTGAQGKPSPSDRLDRLWTVKQTVAQKQHQLVLQHCRYNNSVVKTRKIDVNLLGTRSLSDTLRSELDCAKNSSYVSCLGDADVIKLLSGIANLWHTDYYTHQKILLEKECSARIYKFDVDTMLWIADAFFMVKHRFQLYIRRMLQRVAAEWPSLHLTTPQVVHLLFFVGIHRDMPTDLSYHLEEFLRTNISELTGNELGLVCHAFFASNYYIKDFRLIKSIASSLLKQLSTTHPFMIGNVLKALKHAQYTEVHFYEQLGDFLARPAIKMAPSTLMHVAMAFGSARVFHHQLFDKITAELVHYVDSDKDVRFKTFSRIMWTLATLQHPWPDKVTESLLRMLRCDRQLMLKYPQHVLECLQALMIKGIYPQDLIEFALSEKFRNAVRFESDHQFALLADAKAIEHPHHEGKDSSYRLDEGVGDLEHEFLSRTGLVPLYVALRHLLPAPDMVRCHFVLQHSRIPDIEMHLDSDNRPVRLEQAPLSQQLQSLLASRCNMDSLPATRSIIDSILKEAGHSMEELIESPGTLEPGMIQDRYILPTGKTQRRKILIKLHSWNQYVANAPHLLGHHQMELHLLAKMGYELYLINPTKARHLDALNHASCREFVKNNILERLHVQVSRTAEAV